MLIKDNKVNANKRWFMSLLTFVYNTVHQRSNNLHKSLRGGRWNCRTWKWRTKKDQRLENAGTGKWRTKSQGWKMQDLENDRPNRSSGSGKRLLLFWWKFFKGALSSNTGTKCVFFCCSQTLNITFRRGRQTYAKTYISLYYTVIATKSLDSRHFMIN